MKYKFCSIRINVTKYNLTFTTRHKGDKEKRGYAKATDDDCTLQ